MNYREAICSRILGEAPIVALLDEYAGAGAVFSPRKPEDYEYTDKPAVIIRPPTDMEDVSPFGADLARTLITVSIYALLAPNSTDDSKVSDVARRLRTLFRVPFEGADGTTYQGIVSGPIPAPVDNPRMAGELIQLRLHMEA